MPQIQERQKIKTGVLYRMIDGGVNVRELDEGTRTVPLSFSSEAPVDRWFGLEILDHDSKSVRLDFLNSGRAPLLKDHWREKQTGVIESVTIGTDRTGRAVVRFGKSNLADEEFNDVKDEIRQNVSVGYRVHEMILEKESDEGPNVYRVTDWEPLEISIVSIPADTSVGVGRAQDETREFETTIIINREADTMPEVNTNKDTKVDRQAIETETRQAERFRVNEIMSISEAHGYKEEARQFISEGKSADQYREFVLDKLAARGLKPVEQTDGMIGLTEKESKSFSFLRAIRALSEPNDRKLSEAAAFEFEVSRAFAELVKRDPRGIFIPPDVLARDLTVGTAANGGYLKATELRPQNFIDVLRNRIVCAAAGATFLDDLVGDLAIPKLTAGATAYWVAEGNAPTEGQQTLGQLPLSPKTVAAFTDFSRKLLIQSSLSVENMVRVDLAKIIALAVDLAGLHGSGSSNQPTGVASTSGIGSVVGGTNGAAPDWDDIINLETEVAVDNADMGSLAYITNAKVRGKLKRTLITPTYGDSHIWDRRSPEAPLNGYSALVSNQVSSTLTKGSSTSVCSAIFFGNWADLIIALWSGIDILVDPFTGSNTGTVRVTAFQDADVGVRHAQSFSAMLDALTN